MAILFFLLHVYRKLKLIPRTILLYSTGTKAFTSAYSSSCNPEISRNIKTEERREIKFLPIQEGFENQDLC